MLEVRNLAKSFYRHSGERVPAIDDLTFEVQQGEFVVLLGPSGCGKTTLLRTLSGLEVPDKGEIAVGGEVVWSSAAGVNVPPESRPVGMVFQAYALWPHMKVVENVAFPLRAAGIDKRQSAERVDSILEMLGLTAVAGQYPGQISGGQQQRVALARALVAGHSLVLFDEPLSNVDAKVRQRLRVQLLEEQRRLGFTAVYVTHDQEEALSLATRIAVMRDGRFQQFATPHDTYYRPATRYVANFVGNANIIAGVVERQVSGNLAVRTQFGEILAAAADPNEFRRHDEVILASRPERWRLSEEPTTADAPAMASSARGQIAQSIFLGDRMEYLVEANGENLRVWTDGERIVRPGSQVWVYCDSFWAVSAAERGETSPTRSSDEE